MTEGKEMHEGLSDKIVSTLEDISQDYHKLLLLIGKAGSGKTLILKEISTKTCWPRVNVSKEVAHQLLGLTAKQRALKVSGIVKEIIESQGQDTLLLDNIELLFEVSLKIDPLRLLKEVSRNITLVVSWSGCVDNGSLLYAEPSHPEFRKYQINDLNVMLL